MEELKEVVYANVENESEVRGYEENESEEYVDGENEEYVNEEYADDANEEVDIKRRDFWEEVLEEKKG